MTTSTAALVARNSSMRTVTLVRPGRLMGPVKSLNNNPLALWAPRCRDQVISVLAARVSMGLDCFPRQSAFAVMRGRRWPRRGKLPCPSDPRNFCWSCSTNWRPSSCHRKRQKTAKKGGGAVMFGAARKQFGSGPEISPAPIEPALAAAAK